VKIIISSSQSPITLTLQTCDESSELLVETAKKFLRMRKFWNAEGQMVFNGKEDKKA
jgi:hypothetical protein